MRLALAAKEEEVWTHGENRRSVSAIEAMTARRRDGTRGKVECEEIMVLVIKYFV